MIMKRYVCVNHIDYLYKHVQRRHYLRVVKELDCYSIELCALDFDSHRYLIWSEPTIPHFTFDLNDSSFLNQVFPQGFGTTFPDFVITFKIVKFWFKVNNQYINRNIKYSWAHITRVVVWFHKWNTELYGVKNAWF